MKEKSLQMNIDDPVVAKIKNRIKTTNEALVAQERMKESDYETHRERAESECMKLLYQRKQYSDLCTYCDDNNHFDIIQFEKDCGWAFNDRSSELLNQYLSYFREYIVVKNDIISCVKKVKTYKKEKQLSFTQDIDKIFGNKITSYILMIVFGKSKQKDYLELLQYQADERRKYYPLVDRLQELDFTLQSHREQWKNEQPWLSAYLDIYLAIQEEKLKQENSNNITQTKQYKKEMN